LSGSGVDHLLSGICALKVVRAASWLDERAFLVRHHEIGQPLSALLA
jgi:hypothetical protein